MSDTQKKIRVLLLAYACEPERGSDQGIGWNWAWQIARFAEVWVITRSNNRKVIERYLDKNIIPDIHFLYVDLPPWLMFWKKGQRGVHAYYFFWQIAAYLKARDMIKKVRFDLAHHITFANDWMPSFFALLPVPFVWGPVGGNSVMPKEFLPDLRLRLIDILGSATKQCLRCFNPLFYYTLLRSQAIIMIDYNRHDKFPFSIVERNRYHLTHAVTINAAIIPERSRRCDSIKIVSVGRLIFLKGFYLSIEAFSRALNKFSGMKLFIIGGGKRQGYFSDLASRLGVSDKIIFTGQIPRVEVLRHLSEADIFLFPSFENGGVVVLEAMASGLPVVCLDAGGPGKYIDETCGIKIRLEGATHTIRGLADALIQLSADAGLRYKMGEAGRNRAVDVFSWERKGELVHNIYKKVLLK